MSSKQWQKSSKRIFNFPSIQNTVTGENALVCRHGEVWEDGTRYGVLVTNNRIANWIAAKLDRRGDYKVGDEALFKITTEELGSVIALLQPIRQQKRQIALAEYRFPGTIRTPSELNQFTGDSREMSRSANPVPEIEINSSSAPKTGGQEALNEGPAHHKAAPSTTLLDHSEECDV